MKAKIHPQYNKDAKFTCMNCNTEYKVGSTQKDIKVEICASCHHFWTGQEKDTSKADRVGRFAKRAAAATPTKAKKSA